MPASSSGSTKNRTVLSIFLSEQREAADTTSDVFPRALMPAATFVGQQHNFSLSLTQSHCAAPGDPPRTATNGAGVGCAPAKLIDGSMLFDDKLSLAWHIDCDKSSVQVVVNVSREISGWVGIGFGQNPNMVEVINNQSIIQLIINQQSINNKG